LRRYEREGREIELRIPRIRINAPPEFITALIIAIAASVAEGLGDGGLRGVKPGDELGSRQR